MLMVTHQVTHALIPPAVLSTLEEGDLPLEDILHRLGGEALFSGELVARWSVGRRMVNAFMVRQRLTVCATYQRSCCRGL